MNRSTLRRVIDPLLRACRIPCLRPLVLAALLFGAWGRPTSSLVEAAPSGQGQAPVLETYVRRDRWPERTAGGRAAISDPVALAVASDGRVFISDRGVGGILTMLPDGTFLPPFGTEGDGPERLGEAGRMALDEASDRLYVLDTGGLRVVVYRLDGSFVEAWEGWDGAAIARGPDGRLYVADREQNAIVALDPTTGARLFAVGGHGTEDGRFSLLEDLSVSPDGATLAVGDLAALRVQLFDLRLDGASFRRSYPLQHPKYSAPRAGPPYQQCRAHVVHALGGDAVWVGDGRGACRIEPHGFEHRIAIAAGGGTICKPTVRVPWIRPEEGAYYAIASFDPNIGPCWSSRGPKDTAIATTPAVVRYRDERLAQVDALFLSAVNARADGGLVAPRVVSVPAPERVFVLDRTRTARYFQPDGSTLGTLGLTTRGGLGASQRMRIELADGSTDPGTLFGYYRKEHRGPLAGQEDDRASATPTDNPTASPTPKPTRDVRSTPPPGGRELSGTWVEDEHGIGFFRSSTTREYGQELQVLDPVWTSRFSTQSQERNEQLGRENANALRLVDLAFRDGHDHAFALVYERQAVTRKDDPHLLLVPADGSRRMLRWDLPQDESSTTSLNPYADLSIGPDGRVLVLDDLRDRVVAFAADGTELPTIPVAGDVRAIAGGAGGHLFGLRESGYVERYAPDGTVEARFDGRPFAASDPRNLSGIAADAAGRVYVADAQGSVIGVFEPAPPGGPDLPVPADASCVLRGDKIASPDVLPLGDRTQITLSMDGLCGIGEEPTDIVFVTLFYPPIGVPDPAEETIRELRQMVSRVDFDQHRVGIVAYFRDTRLELPLSDDRDAVLAEIPRLTRRWPPSCEIRNGRPFCWVPIYPILREGLKVAAKALEGSGDRRKVIVLHHPEYCNRDLAYNDGDCRPWPDAAETAAEIRADGIQIVVHDGGRTGWRSYRFDGSLYAADAQPLASSDADVVFDRASLQHRMVRYHVPDVLATDLRLVDTLAATMRLVPGSVSSGGIAVGSDVTWTQARLPFGRSDFSIEVEPQRVGRWPTNAQAEATFVDGWGRPGRVLFPVPFVEVHEAPPTTTPTPTATREPTPPRPSATPGPPPGPIYLPLAMRSHCLPGTLRFDVVLVLDSSTSMAGSKLRAATQAVSTFLDVLELGLGADAAALVAFDEEARIVHDLSVDAAALRTALAGLDVRPGTRIDRGLATALDILLAEPSSLRRQPLVVLLSDGRQADAGPILVQGARAARAGVDVFTIGLGEDVDAPVLAQIASSPGHAFLAPDEADLRRIYEEVGRTIPCR